MRIFTEFKKEIYKRISNLKKVLEQNHIEAALILQNADLFYFSGTIQKSCLYVPVSDEPTLLIIKSYSRAIEESPITNTIKIKSIKQIKDVLRKNKIKIPSIIGLELDVLPTNLFFIIKNQFTPKNIIDISNSIKIIRSIKTNYEISIIKKAAQKSDQLARYAQKKIQPGLIESKAAGIIECKARELGHNHIIRMRSWGNEICYGSLMSGASAAVPSYLESPNGGKGIHQSVGHGPGLDVISRKEPILFDYAFVYKGYISDQTRIFCIGKLPKHLIQAHKTVLDLEKKIVEKTKPGMLASEIYNLAINFMTKAGYKDNFMGSKSNQVRFIGHGVGLEIDEYPTIGKNQHSVLKPNMTIALEPKLIFPNEGVVGTENTYHLGKDGLKNLHKFSNSICEIKTFTHIKNED